MNVLIIAKTRAEFDAVRATYNSPYDKQNVYHHITTKEQMQSFRMPVRIRFVGNWWKLPDAPTLEFYAGHIIGAPPEKLPEPNLGQPIKKGI